VEDYFNASDRLVFLFAALLLKGCAMIQDVTDGKERGIARAYALSPKAYAAAVRILPERRELHNG